MTQPEILSIREAEAALNLSGPRIHQLLVTGELLGPALERGRKRHSPGAPRVTMASIVRYIEDLESKSPASEGGRPSRTSNPPGARTATPDEGSTSTGAAAQELKVKLDAMREELRAERTRSRDLLDVIDKLVAVLRDTQVSADHLDDVTDGYSQALTQLLTPDSLPPDT